MTRLKFTPGDSIVEQFLSLRTIKDRTALCRCIIDGEPIDQPFRGEALALMRVVFNDDAITEVVRVVNPLFPTDRRHLLVSDASGTESRSWRKACGQTVDPLTRACRASVPWVPLNGAMCSDCASMRATDRDHVRPQFVEIVAAIRAKFGEDYSTVRVAGGGVRLTGAALDMLVSMNASAVIEPVCAPCHRARTSARRAAP